tara:strand:+ start:155 stop:937 length:783 start_codon:yes stop_codon:yes gene_type:complete
MIVTFTDFGVQGPYLGQMRAAIMDVAPRVPVIDLMSDVPAFDVRAAAYLLPAVMAPFAAGTVCLGVVDPGVGSQRRPVVLKADDRWFVGPDNGLFEIVARRAQCASWWDITWRPDILSSSFHGRDLFAPVAAEIARGLQTDGAPALGRCAAIQHADGVPNSLFGDLPDDLPAVIYIDGYGNCMTGLRWDNLDGRACLRIGEFTVMRADTFSDVEIGTPFFYKNALGLLEIAVNQGRADADIDLSVGSQVSVRNLCDVKVK